MTTRARLTAISAGLMALTLSACSSTAEGESDTTEAGDGRAEELSIGVPADLGGWNTADSSWGLEAIYFQAVYDTLTRTDADGTVVPALASEWSYDESRTTLTMQLRDDVVFGDGTEFTAEIAAENIERFRDGASPNTENLSAIENVIVDDEYTLVLELSSPNPALLSYFSQNAGLQASPEAFNGDETSAPIGSGPYEYAADASIPGSRYVFTAREDYWDPEAQHYDEITMYHYADTTAMLNALRDDQVDFARLHGVEQITDAEAAGYTTNSTMDAWSGFILADREGTNNEALGDVRVRQAINHALDRDALLDAIEQGYGEPTTQIFGTETTAFDEELEDAYPYDPERAQELLEEAGYPEGITITQPKTSFVPESEFELVAGMLADSGIETEPEQVGSTFIGDLLGGRWSAFQFGLDQEAEPWTTYQNAIAPNSPWNVFGVEDDTISELAERMSNGGDDAAAASLELNQYVVEQAWFAPIYRSQSTLVTSDGTEVINKVGQGQPNLWDITPVE